MSKQSVTTNNGFLTPHQTLAFAFGATFVTAIFVVAFAMPNPSPFSYMVFRIILAIAAAGVTAVIPGLLHVKLGKAIVGSGSLAVFVIVYFCSTASLTGVNVQTAAEAQIAKPIVRSAATYDVIQRLSRPFRPSSTLPDMVVRNADQLLVPGVLDQRYGTVSIVGVLAFVPAKATLVANEVLGHGQGGLKGSDFSVVARRIANITVDARSTLPNSAKANLHIYAKTVENTHIDMRGMPGRDGADGKDGAPGYDGLPGKHGSCAGLGGYDGARAGSDGGDGENGADGKPGQDGGAGGNFTLMAIAHPIASAFQLDGGAPGKPGNGGKGGQFGKGGRGGDGCSGLGGTQPSRPAGHDGREGRVGATGAPGRKGPAGEYQLVLVPTFDAIEQMLRIQPNRLLHESLAKVVWP